MTILTILVTLLSLLPAWAAEGALKDAWPVRSAHLYRDALEGGAGFSFVYDGKECPAGWTVSVEGAQTRYRHSSGLVATRVTRQFPEAEAVEYTVRFKNESGAASAVLGPVLAMNLAFGGAALENASIITSNGGSGDSFYPPKQYALSRRLMGPLFNPPAASFLKIDSPSGKSSRGDLPFFFVEDAQRQAGIFVAVGWTGVWEAEIRGDFLKNQLLLTGGMPGIAIRLQPGEEISGPQILIGAYRGPFAAGSNRLRRLIRDRYTPLLEGRKPLPVIGYSSWYSVFNAFNEKSLRALADVAADLEQEVFEVDSGWFAGTRMGPTNGEWQWGVGNWEKVDPIRFPNGMRPLVDYVHSKGMKFGLWIEPERANRESLLGKAHAEWLIWPPGPRNLKNDREWALVDFGLKEAQDWWIEFLCRYIREYSIRYLRWDLNFTPADTWAAHDKAGRRGITQIRHVEGLHRVMREVLRRNPGTLIENCAGGGGRVDLQSMEHAHAFWLTNHSSDPHVVRHYLGGANHIVPTAYSIVAFELPVWWKKSFEFPDILFQSYFGGAFGISTNIAEWPPAMRAQAKKHVQAYKKIRKYLVEDYYRLLPAPADLEAWEAWQFHDPKNGDGFVQAFRTGSPEASRAIWLQALDARKTYRFTDVYTGASFQAPGAKAVNFELPAMSSKVLVYEPVPGR